MNLQTQITVPQDVNLQERAVEIVEDAARPAEQILTEQIEQDGHPSLFVP